MAFEFVARNGIIALDNSTISGSLSVTNNISGSIFTGSFIGTLTGTSSFSTSGSQAISASFATSASYALSASYAFSASNALTASYVEASNVVGLNLSQIATGSITASVSNGSGSFAITSGSSTFLFVSSSGNTGFGTTSPIVSIQTAGDVAVAMDKAFGFIRSGFFVTTLKKFSADDSVELTNINNSYLKFSTNNTERVRIINTGLVGIGTNSPLALLHVSGTSGALLQTTSGSTTGLFVSSSGFVGLGTTSPSASLDVAGGGMVVRGGISTSPTQLNGLHFNFASNIGYISSVQGNVAGRALEIRGYPLRFKNANDGTEVVTISTANNVGISNVTPNAKLDVSGNVLVSGSLAVSGSASITGSLGVTGNITAQTLIVQTVSSSIIYSSGSNIFGDATNDNQIFTGSVLVSGSITVSGSVTNNLTASYALNADALDGINSTQLATTGSNIFRGNQSITGSLIVSSSTFATSLIGSGSGVFTVDGTSGRLFSVDDSLSGSLFSVNTAAGLPVIEAFSDNTVRIGQFGRRALFVSQSRVGFGKETQLNGDIDVSGSVVITGSLSVSGSIVNNLTSSFAISASYANNFDAGYAKTFSQLTPAVTWSIIHDLNSLVPLIQVYDLNYSQILPASIVNTSRSGSSITFATSQAGYAVISTGGITVTGSNAILSQTTPATTWSFAHNLNTQFPVFTVFDSSNNVIMPLQINATNANSASIYFSSPQIGTAVAANGGVGAAASNNATASFTNSSTWTFSHNLNNRNVMIQTFDSSFNQIIPQNVRLTDINTATITFPSNTSGLAIASIGGVTGQAVSASYAFTSSYVLPLSQSVIITGSLLMSGSLIMTGGVSINGGVTISTGNSLYVPRIDAPNSTNSGSITLNNNSIILARNVADANPVARIQQTNVSGTGDILQLQNSAGTVLVNVNASGSLTGSNARFSGTLTAQTLVVQTVTSSVSFITGSTQFGSLATNTHQFTGSVLMSGSATALAVNNNALFVSSSGFIGMGVTGSTNPVRLSVSGAIESLMDAGGEGGQLTLRGNTFQYGIDNYLGNNFRIIRENDGTGAAGIVLMNISASGNVGIGTASPSANLHISGYTSGLPASSGAAQRGGFRIANSSNIAFDFGTVAAGQAWIQISDANNYASNFALLLNPNGGNVYIGNTTGDGRFYVKTSTAVSYSPTVYTGTNANIRLETGGTPATNVTTGISMGVGGAAEAYIGAVQNASTYADIVFQSYNGAYGERMRITSGGEVGIGMTPTSGNRFMIRGSSTSSGDTSLYVENSSSTRLFACRNDGAHFLSSFTYGNTVSGGVRNLFIDNTFALGGISSILASKKNIQEFDSNWIYDLKPVQFNYRKKDEEGNYTEEIYEEINYGLIAEDTEPIANFLINYNDKEDGTKEMVGIEYMRLITPMLKAIQEQQSLITSLTARITELENK